MALVLFILLAIGLVALPPLIATIFFDHVRTDPDPVLNVSHRRRGPVRRFAARTRFAGRRL